MWTRHAETFTLTFHVKKLLGPGNLLHSLHASHFALRNWTINQTRDFDSKFGLEDPCLCSQLEANWISPLSLVLIFAKISYCNIISRLNVIG